MNRKIKGEWVRSSSTPQREQRLKEHEEFLKSPLKARLDEGYQLTGARKRPRIQRERKQQQPLEEYGFTIVWGERMKVSLKVFKERFEPLGFTFIAEF